MPRLAEPLSNCVLDDKIKGVFLDVNMDWTWYAVRGFKASVAIWIRQQDVQVHRAFVSY